LGFGKKTVTGVRKARTRNPVSEEEFILLSGNLDT
jgi:hypothetical protein